MKVADTATVIIFWQDDRSEKRLSRILSRVKLSAHLSFRDSYHTRKLISIAGLNRNQLLKITWKTASVPLKQISVMENPPCNR
jgi:hypothetical protein